MRYAKLIFRAIIWLPMAAFYKMFPAAALRAALAIEKDNLAAAAKAVAMQPAYIARLQRAVDEDTKQSAILEKQIEIAFKSGNEFQARELAAKLSKTKARLTKNSQELEATRKAYDQNVQLLKSNAAMLRDKAEDIEQMEVRRRMAEAKKTSAEMSAQLRGKLTGTNGLMTEAYKNMQDQIDSAEGEADLVGQMADVDIEGDKIQANFEADEEFELLRNKYAPKQQESGVLEQVLQASEQQKAN